MLWMKKFQESETVTRINFPFRLMPSLMESARKAAKSEGVSVNQLFNVAVAEKLAVLRADTLFPGRIHRADRASSRRTVDPARPENPPVEAGEPVPGEHDAGENRKAFGLATPQLGQLRKRLDKFGLR